MKSHREILKEYNKSLKSWKEGKINEIMKSHAYRYHNLNEKYDHRLTKGTMYKNLFPDEKNVFTRWFYQTLEDPKHDKTFFTPPSLIYEVQKVRQLKRKRDEAYNSGNVVKVENYNHAISIEIGKFKLSAIESQLSPETLEILGTSLSEIIETRTKKIQCQLTVNLLIEKHYWFRNIIEEFAKNGSPRPKVPPNVKLLEEEYETLEHWKREKQDDNEKGKQTFDMNDVELQINLNEKYKEIQIAKSDYLISLREHFEYLGNNIYDLKEKKYDANKIESLKLLEQIIKLFAWFYKRLFWADKEQFQEKQRDKRNTARKKSGAFEERKILVQGCKKKGLNKKQTERETGLSYPTVFKYWEMD